MLTTCFCLMLTPISKDDGASVSQKEAEMVGDNSLCHLPFHSPRGGTSCSDPVLSGLQLPSVNCQCLYQKGHVQLVSVRDSPVPAL